MANRNARIPRGFSLIELVVATAISAAVVTLAAQAMIAFARTQALRQKVIAVQGQARLALGWMEADLRHASLGAGSGVIWTRAGLDRVSRPAIQIFSDVPGGGMLDVKPGTDALLVVEVSRAATAQAATVGDLSTSTNAVNVTDASRFSVGDAILMGDYGEASWGVVATATASGAVNQLTLQDQTVNVVPGQQLRRLPSGSFVRPARARLYYVDTADELVLLTLAAPRAPSDGAEVLSRDALARGFENMKINCQLDNGGGGFQGCPAVLGIADPVSIESAAAFGALQAGRGPVLTSANISMLRTVVVSVAVRSQQPLHDHQGDPKIPLAGLTLPATALPVGGGDDTAAYVRRAYQLVAAVRNTSLGVF